MIKYILFIFKDKRQKINTNKKNHQDNFFHAGQALHCCKQAERAMICVLTKRNLRIMRQI